jgi:Transposase DDE domain
MLKSIPFFHFAQLLFDSKDLARTAAVILKAILEAQSPRLSDIAQKMPGTPEANYKQIQRFLVKIDPQSILLRLFQTDAPFVLGDPTEIPRPEAWHTSYVGTLSDGKTKGFWLLTLATPFRGRALPFHFVTYSSKTIADEESSRNLKHLKALATVKDLIGEKPLVFDREFSYLELLEKLVAERVHFVIRLKLGSHPPQLTNATNQSISLTIAPGDTEIYRGLYYKGSVPLNVIGVWKPGLSEPLWVMTDLRPEAGLQIYFQRMKIDESFRDLKSLLHLDKLMNKKSEHMEKMIALVMLAYSIGVLTGEGVRDAIFSESIKARARVPITERIPDHPDLRQGKKWKLYSGLFILLKQKVDLPLQNRRQIFRAVLPVFTGLIQHPVRTPV